MNNLHPAMSVMVMTGIILTCIFPITLWFGLIRQRDISSKLWLFGALSLSVAVICVAILKKASWISGSALGLSFLLYIESMRLEAKRAPTSLGLIFIVTAGIISTELSIDLLGLRVPWGIVLTSAVIVLFGIVLLHLILLLHRKLASRGLIVMSVGVALPSLVSFSRLVFFIISNEANDIITYLPLSNAALMSFTIGGLLQSVGYMIYSYEKNSIQILEGRLEIARIEERRLASEKKSKELQGIIKERDNLIMMSSRLNSLNSFAILNTALVHEISQPLQALYSSLEVLRFRAEKSSHQLQDGLEEAIDLTRSISSVLTALRQLIIHRDPVIEMVNIRDTIQEIIDIVRDPVSRRGVLLDFQANTLVKFQDLNVSANKVLLLRLIINIVNNSLEAMDNNNYNSNIHILIFSFEIIKADGGKDLFSIKIRDTGPGFPADIIESGPSDFYTTKSQGTGLGLVIGRATAESWNGRLQLSNWSDGDLSGACTEIHLQMV